MKQNRSSRGCADGFTAVELVVAMLVTGVIAGAALSITLRSRSILDRDEARIEIDQDLRIGMDLLGVDIRQAGERLPQDFPAIQITDGAAGAADTLIIRRNLLDQVLPICGTINSGTISSEVRIALSSFAAPQGCAPVADENGDGWPDNVEAWRDHRDANGGSVKAYIYNPVTHEGEFFEYDGDGATTFFIHKAGSDPWQYTYRITQLCRVYIIEERTYTLNGDLLQLVLDEDTGSALNVLQGLRNFQLRALLTDGTVTDSIGTTDPWDELSGLEVTLDGFSNSDDRPMDRSLTSRFFPRNVLSL